MAAKKNKKFIIGVTGGFSSGKTTVSAFFREKGAYVIDADDISHDILEYDRAAIKKVISLFGEDIAPGGKVDRKKLSDKVFRDGSALRKLCAVMHPRIKNVISKKIVKCRRNVIVVDAALLIESGIDEMADVVVLVRAKKNIQLERASARGYSKAKAAGIIKNQLPFSAKKEFADFIIDNNGSLKKTKEGVDKIWQGL